MGPKAAKTTARRRREQGGGFGSSWIRADRRRALYARDGYICLYCGRDTRADDLGGPTLDHVDPAGGHDDRNLVVACRTCNKAKGSRPIREFAGDDWPRVERELRSRRARSMIDAHRADERERTEARLRRAIVASLRDWIDHGEVAAGSLLAAWIEEARGEAASEASEDRDPLDYDRLF